MGRKWGLAASSVATTLVMFCLLLCAADARRAKQGCSCKGAAKSPVCGTDGVTYPNQCKAACAGVGVDYKGECRSTNPNCPGICTAQYQPVCGEDGRTYGNACQASCAGVASAEGACPCPAEDPAGCAAVTCTAIYEPVCGCNGKEYGNGCQAECAGIKDYTPGKCPCPDEDPSGCAAVLCPDTADPVCGCNGKEYGNSCLAECAGITSYTAGTCPTLAETDDLFTCPAGAPTAKCAGDVCDQATCAARPDAVCLNNPCPRLYRGVTLDQVCYPYFYDPVTLDIVDCSRKGAGCAAKGKKCNKRGA